ENGIRDATVTGVQTCALPIYLTKNARNQSEQGVPIQKFVCFFMHFHGFGNVFPSQNFAHLCMLWCLTVCNGNLGPSRFPVGCMKIGRASCRDRWWYAD